MKAELEGAISKVPAVTLVFWGVKIVATTLGETGGDALSMSMHLGYLLSTGIFAVVFALAVWAQIRAKKFHAELYWLTIIATTTLGTTLADFADRSLGVGYAGGSSLLLLLLLTSLLVWYRKMGTLAVASIQSARAEMYYWTAIMFSQTLGTALGDWTADTAGLGYVGGAWVFGTMLLLIAVAYRWSRLSHTLLFWAAFILTRPLGAVLGDWMDKPLAQGGLELSRYSASLTLLCSIVLLLWRFPSRPATQAH